MSQIVQEDLLARLYEAERIGDQEQMQALLKRAYPATKNAWKMNYLKPQWWWHMYMSLPTKKGLPVLWILAGNSLQGPDQADARGKTPKDATSNDTPRHYPPLTWVATWDHNPTDEEINVHLPDEHKIDRSQG